ncbi:MAG: putative metal-dependent hydrolase [Bacteroidetes bacterium]|nr:putative metal-dependent hydrolase [Bacteroidota bacterium]
MSEENLDLVRYPIGKRPKVVDVSPAAILNYINDLESLPTRLRNAISGWSEAQLSQSYRPDGWAIKQLIHHIADSHMQAYIRFKFAIAEDNFTVKPYDENVWASLEDATNSDVEFSLNIIDGMHKRLAAFLRSLSPAQLKRKFFHPELGELVMEEYIGLYAWHSNHHLAQIIGLKDRMGW